MQENIACLECDALLHAPSLNSKQSAYCPRCGALVTAKSPNNLQYSLAFSLAGLNFIIVAHFFPFLIFEAQGQSLQMSLMQSAWVLHDYGQSLLAVAVFFFIALIPGGLCLAIIYVLFSMLFLRTLPPLGLVLSRWLFQVKVWSMAEVFLAGVLVSLTKIVTMADIRIGWSFWAYILFVICLSASLSNLDRYRFWHYYEHLRHSARQRFK
ncbi:hypothetical protein C2869_05555 [Saccharobesus litoralis]|uniref:Paraquat-inducible protein A n=1 Tax=Saccharobesus litoralis TaxID=2172099 RepID=A0A2S0VPC6_9ALTE|nr:paraquat-inducible protein A [Saccharobesus litoralis]AWB65940.1 hypothetical protein C2869_05555 [Saccharobesus litoralis]